MPTEEENLHRAEDTRVALNMVRAYLSDTRGETHNLAKDMIDQLLKSEPYQKQLDYLHGLLVVGAILVKQEAKESGISEDQMVTLLQGILAKP